MTKPFHIFWPLIAALAIPTKPPKMPPIIVPKKGKFPFGSIFITGLLAQYAYRFNPLIDSGSKYSILYALMNLHNSGE